MAKHLKADRRAMERDPEIAQARAGLLDIIADAEMERLKLVRDAFLTVDGLAHTNYRPTAWWFPLVDSSGAWIEAVGKTATARWEWLLSQ